MAEVITTQWVCDCEHCATGRLVHWKCDGCGAGPFRFSHADPAGVPTKTPYGQRQYNRPNGLVGGVRRWCSARCALTEEKVYLMDQLERAHERRDMNAVRVFTGRLHEMSQDNPAQIPSVPESMTRRPETATPPEPQQLELSFDDDLPPEAA